MTGFAVGQTAPSMTSLVRTRAIPGVAFVLAFVAAGVGVAALAARRAGVAGGEGTALAAALAALGMLLVPVAALSLEGVVDRLRTWVGRRAFRSFLLASMPIVPYLLYWGIAGSASPGGLLRVVAYVFVATSLALLPSSERRRAAGDGLVVLAIWLAAEFDWLAGSFPWPGRGAGLLLASALGLGLLLLLTLVVRRLDGVGYTCRLGWRDTGLAVAAFAVFAAVGIPLGLATGFLLAPRELPGVTEAVGRFVAILLFTGVPEETLFRGFVQGLLERWTGRPRVALGAASLLFGAAHLNNGPFPDWRYFVLAAGAGVAYGWVYQRTRRLAAPALTHAFVDATWSLFLGGR